MTKKTDESQTIVASGNVSGVARDIVGSSIEHAFNTVQESEASDELKAALNELTSAVEVMLTEAAQDQLLTT